MPDFLAELRWSVGEALRTWPASLWVLLIGLAAAVVMVGAIGEMAADPRPIYFVTKPQPTPTEQHVVTPLAQCDRFGCQRLYDVGPTPP